jgi:hypothetical protein
MECHLCSKISETYNILTYVNVGTSGKMCTEGVYRLSLGTSWTKTILFGNTDSY